MISRGKGDAASLHIVNVFNELAQKIRTLDRIPLPISDIAALDSVLRFCAGKRKLFFFLFFLIFFFSSVFPPSESCLLDGSVSSKQIYASLAVPTIEFLVQYAPSSAWPDSKDAVHHLLNAFRIKTRQELARVFQISSVLQNDSLDILFKGFLFRMRCEHKKTPLLQLRSVHCSAIAGFHMRHNAFGSATR